MCYGIFPEMLKKLKRKVHTRFYRNLELSNTLIVQKGRDIKVSVTLHQQNNVGY